MKQLFYALVLVCSLLACQKDQFLPALVQTETTARLASSDSLGKGRSHVLLGMPIQAEKVLVSSDTLLMLKDQYVVSYNRSLGRANWVGWHLQKSDLGNSDR